MSIIIRTNNAQPSKQKSAYNNIFKQVGSLFDIDSVEGNIALSVSGEPVSYSPFITFNNLFFNGTRNFIIDFLVKKGSGNSEHPFFSYIPAYNSKFGAFLPGLEGFAAPPPRTFTGEEPLEFGILTVRENNPDKYKIRLELSFVTKLYVNNPIHNPNYELGDPAPEVGDPFEQLFPITQDNDLFKSVKNKIKVPVKEFFTLDFTVPEALINEDYSHYSFNLNFDNHIYDIYINNNLLAKSVFQHDLYYRQKDVGFSNILYEEDTTFHKVPRLNTRISLPANFSGIQTSELRFWEGGVNQNKIYEYAFKRIDYKTHEKLIHYYPLANYTNNNPLQLTDLVGSNHGSLGLDGADDTRLWEVIDPAKYPFQPIIKNLTTDNKELDSITISWDYDDLFDITGFDVYIDGAKYNDDELPLASSDEYKITGLSPATFYEIEIAAKGPVRVVDNYSDELATSTVDPDAGGSYAVDLIMKDSAGDGWDGDSFIGVADEEGIIFIGTLDTGYEKVIPLNLVDKQYQVVVANLDNPDEVSFEIVLDNGTLIAAGYGEGELFFNPSEEYVPPPPIVIPDRPGANADLTTENIRASGFVVVLWTARSNTGTFINYKAYFSTSPNLNGDVNTIQANAEIVSDLPLQPAGQVGEAGIDSGDVLSPNTTYYFNVIATDGKDETFVYNMNSEITLA